MARSVGSIVVAINARTRGFESKIAKSERSIKRFQNRVEDVGRSVTKFGGVLTKRLTLPLVLVAAASVKAAASFDKAMTESLAIMGNVTDAQRMKMERLAKQMSNQSTFAAKELGEAYFFLASAGLNVEQSMSALPVVTRFAQAGAFDMAIATDLLTDAQSALGLSFKDPIRNMKEMTRLSDVLVKANTLANATVQQFSEALTNQAGPAMRAYKIDLEEGVAVLAAYADQGIKGNVAGSLFARTLRLLSSMAVKNADAFKALNIDVFDDITGDLKPLNQIISQLSTRLGVLGVKQRTVALEALGFRARIQGAILPLLGLGEKVKEYETNLRSAADITKEVSAKQLKAFSNQLTIAKNKIVNVGISIGMVLIPHVVKLVERIAKLIEKFDKLSDAKKSWIVVIGLSVMALGPLVSIVGKLILGLRTLIILLPTFAAILAIPIAVSVAWVAIAAAFVIIAVRIHQIRKDTEILNKSMDDLADIEGRQKKAFGVTDTKTLAAVRRAVQSGDIDRIEKMRQAFPKAVAEAEALIGKVKQIAKETEAASEAIDVAEEMRKILDELENGEDRANKARKAEEKYLKTVARLQLERAKGEDKINLMYDRRKKLQSDLAVAEGASKFEIMEKLALNRASVEAIQEELEKERKRSDKKSISFNPKVAAAQKGTVEAYRALNRGQQSDKKIQESIAGNTKETNELLDELIATIGDDASINAPIFEIVG